MSLLPAACPVTAYKRFGQVAPGTDENHLSHTELPGEVIVGEEFYRVVVAHDPAGIGVPRMRLGIILDKPPVLGSLLIGHTRPAVTGILV